ncbi:hypothetical protein IWX46DRAFT_66792 [Phyllosticta citricarpa]|uniref:Secreted protein n=1 Tax=Phyllosticta citricarpa TaxID=55181 RepID=A0ABR1MEA0_9PEZI
MMDRQPLVRSFVLLFFVLLSAPCPPAVGGFFFFFFFLALLPPHTTTDFCSASAKSEGRAHQLTIAREGRQRIDNQVGRQLTPLSRAEIGCSLGSGMRQN